MKEQISLFPETLPGLAGRRWFIESSGDKEGLCYEGTCALGLPDPLAGGEIILTLSDELDYTADMVMVRAFPGESIYKVTIQHDSTARVFYVTRELPTLFQALEKIACPQCLLWLTWQHIREKVVV